MERKHNIRCERANPKSKCRCRCGGKLHGILYKSSENDLNIKHINGSMGKEVTEIFNKLIDKEFKCTCGKKFKIGGFFGYLHDAGLEDKKGQKWWIFIECPNCDHQWSWHKIESRLNK